MQMFKYKAISRSGIPVDGIIMVYAVPQFTKSFITMGIELPLPTRMIIGLSDFCTKYIAVILILTIAVILAMRFYNNRERTRTARKTEFETSDSGKS